MTLTQEKIKRQEAKCKSVVIPIILSFLSIFILAIFLQGCATKVPVTKTKIVKVPEITFNTNDSSPLTKKGLTIKIKPILGKDIKQFPQFTNELHYSGIQIQRVYSYQYGRDINKEVEYRGHFELPLFPLPAFELSITNNTDHVIKFSNATLALEDSNGNLFDVLSKQDLPSYLDQAIKVNLSKNNIPQDAFVDNRDELYADQRQVKLVDNNFKVLPGRTTKGYLVFNYGKYTLEDFRVFVFSQQTLNVQLFELPIKVDKAANVLETTSFSFVFDIKIHERKEEYTVYEYVYDSNKPDPKKTNETPIQTQSQEEEIPNETPIQTIPPNEGIPEVVIIKVQQQLQDLGYEPGPADGKMGPRTSSALKKFQSSNNLTVTGEADKSTIELLEQKTTQ